MHPFDFFPLAVLAGGITPALIRAGTDAAREYAATRQRATRAAGFLDGSVTVTDPVSAALRAYGRRRGVRARRALAGALRALARMIDAPSPL
jgi:hypothetical protein